MARGFAEKISSQISVRLTGPVSPRTVQIGSATPVSMFLKSLSASLVLVGVVVAAVNFHAQDPDSLPGVFANTQVPVHTTQTEVTSTGLIFHFRSLY
jgi:hypothetical protein